MTEASRDDVRDQVSTFEEVPVDWHSCLLTGEIETLGEFVPNFGNLLVGNMGMGVLMIERSELSTTPEQFVEEVRAFWEQHNKGVLGIDVSWKDEAATAQEKEKMAKHAAGGEEGSLGAKIRELCKLAAEKAGTQLE